MQRREWVQGAVLAGAAGLSRRLPTIRVADQAAPEPAQNDGIVVEGLVAGYLRDSHLKGAKAGGVDVWVGGGPGDIAGYSGALNFFDRHKGEIVLAKSVADIRRAKADKKIANVFNWQSAGALGDDFNGTMGGTGTSLRAWYEIGLRIVGLCYNVTNVFGGGCLEPQVPLTRAGRRLVDEIHALNILLDVGGHTGEQTSLDAIAASRGVPVVCTHTNVASIADNPRCISDRLIDAIAGTGGVVGLTAVNDFHVRNRKDAAVPHSPRVTVEAYLDQFEYIKKRVGVDHVGMGPDFVDGMPLNYDAVNREVISRDMISDGEWFYVKGFEGPAEVPNVIQGLKRRGWSAEDVDKAMGANWLRVYQKAWGA
ncbi:MAG: membrane dipeptidase [Gemmatimonadota bacterium]